MQQILTLISLQPSSNIISNTFPQSNLLGIALNVISFSNSISRIVDYGATKHIVYYPSFISYITSHCFKNVQLPNGSKASTTHIGIIHLTSNIVLKNVLCIKF